MSEFDRKQQPNNYLQPQSSPPDSLRKINSDSLLLGEKEVLIVHGEEMYRLRLTKNDKLILQK